MPNPATGTVSSATTRVDVDLGDAGLVVVEYPDGLFVWDVNGARLVVNAEQMEAIVRDFVQLGTRKGWL